MSQRENWSTFWPRLLASGLGLLICAQAMQAQDILPTVEWNGTSGTWSTAASWTVLGTDPVVNRVPGTGDVASVTDGSAQVTSSVTGVHALGISGGRVDLKTGGSLTVSNETVVGPLGTLGVGGGSLTTGSLGVFGTLDLDSNFAKDFTLGKTYPVATATSVAGAPKVTVGGQTPTLPRGVGLNLLPTSTGASVVVESVPVLTIDRTTGATAMSNFGGGTLNIAGYTLTSPSGILSRSSTNYKSFSDGGATGFLEVNATVNRLSEYNLTGSKSFTNGQSHSFGNTYTGIGKKPRDEDIGFEYLTADGRVLPGIIEYLGPPSDLTLAIDPATGAATIQNLSTVAGDFNITGFTVSSPSGSLVPSGLTGLGAGWETANPQATGLTQVNLRGSQLFSSGISKSIGNIFKTSGANRDLVFRYSLASGQVSNGSIVYGAATPPGCTPLNTLLGDLDGNRSVEFSDFLSLSANFGQKVSKYSDGDIDCNGSVEFSDFLTLSSNFGKSLGATASVPEPSTGILTMLGLLGLLRFRKRSSQVAGAFIAVALVAQLAPTVSAQEFDSRFIRLHPASPNGAINSAIEARNILRGLQKDVILNENMTGKVGYMDLGGGKGAFDFGQEGYLNGVTGEGMNNFTQYVSGVVEIPAGTWSIGFGSDDGGFIHMPGIRFTQTFNESADGVAAASDGEIFFNGGRGHDFTYGTFTVPAGGIKTGFEAMFFEGGGGDSWEIAIVDEAAEAAADAAARVAYWGGSGSELTNGALGWKITNEKFVPFSPADFDRNGVIDSADASAISRNFGRAAGPFTGDITADGIVDLKDVAAFAPIFRAAQPGGAPPTVPEPASCLLIGIGAAGLLRFRRRRS